MSFEEEYREYERAKAHHDDEMILRDLETANAELSKLRGAVVWLHAGTEAEQVAKLDRWNEVQLFEIDDPAVALIAAHEEARKQ